MALLPLLGVASEVIGKALGFFEGDEKEKAKQTLAMLQAETELLKGQQDINKQEAVHRSLFVAGWRPAVGWACALALVYETLIRPMVTAFYPNIVIPSISNVLLEVLFAMLGIGGLRSFEKYRGLTK